MTTAVDLSQLARARPDCTATAGAAPVRRRSFFSRYVLSGAILLGFAVLVAWAARDQLLPRKAVTVAPVITMRGELRQEGTPLFQAAGWIEPRPTPMLVTALTEGVVEKLFVVEGQAVKAGEPLAQLIDSDAKLALRDAEAALALRQAEVASMDAELKAAELRMANPVHLDAALAEADSLLAKTETELAKVPFLIESAQARLDFARRNLEGKRAAAGGIAERMLQQAESDFAGAEAELAELKQRTPRLQREAETLHRKHSALAEQRRLLIDESRGVADTRAKRGAAVARQDQAKLAVERARLMLERTAIRAPSDGKVLQLVARPGTRVTAMEGAAAMGAATIVTLYDPQMLQVRADVRLDDVAGVEAGQPVRIETASVKTPLEGFVLQPTSIANIQKNTLEVKVAIKNPPPTVRPEMLVSATFLAPAKPETSDEKQTAPQRLLIRKDLVAPGSGGQSVWLATADGRAEQRPVQLGRAADNGLIEVVEGLTPTDKVIVGGREGLQNGDRIAVSNAADINL
ncbi:MAG: efflux RND transporter periplasmic adaptor subunit [Planctomycetes bacterium]|nr:efflux RND transporter periplasmic adaptor subunit [Planctomycetota bacterium]